MTRKIAGTKADPTMPKSPIVIGGQTYNLCFDLGALAEAENAINTELVLGGRPERVNLLAALPTQNLVNTRVCFAAGLRTFHPDITFDQALKMITFDALYEVADTIRTAWRAAQPAEETADPQRPGE